MKKIILVMGITLMTSVLFGQQLPPLNQYYADPFVYNSSLLALSNRKEINLLYRMQWSGNSDNPKTAMANIQVPLGKKISVGGSVYNDDVILLSTTSIQGVVNYRLPISSTQAIRFGMGLGALQNRVDLSKVETPEDPVFQNADNNFKLDGQLGLSFVSNKFLLGASVLNLLNSKTFSTDAVGDVKFNSSQNRVIMSSYRFDLGQNFSVEPWALFHFRNTGKDYWETQVKITYREKVSLGLFYRDGYGVGGSLRFRIGQAISVGYSTEYAVQNGYKSSNFQQGTHEFQGKFYFDKSNKSPEVKEDVKTEEEFASVEEEQKIQQEATVTSSPVQKNSPEPAPERVQEDVAPSEVTVIPATSNYATTTEGPSHQSETIELVVKKGTSESDTPSDEGGEMDVDSETSMYYLVAGSFKEKQNAAKYASRLNNKGHQTKTVFDPATGNTYVYLPGYDHKRPDIDLLQRLQDELGLNEIWFKKDLPTSKK